MPIGSPVSTTRDEKSKSGDRITTNSLLLDSLGYVAPAVFARRRAEMQAEEIFYMDAGEGDSNAVSFSRPFPAENERPTLTGTHTRVGTANEGNSDASAFSAGCARSRCTAADLRTQLRNDSED
jgi:hypothetical protein